MEFKCCSINQESYGGSDTYEKNVVKEREMASGG